jgi:predicted HAD superfamily Cof-like phosphohydrolase
MKSYTELVTEFHHRNGAVVAGKANGPEVAALRLGLIIEELAETLAAMRDQDRVEAADGLTDLLYVVAGTAVSYGVALQAEIEDPLGRPAERFAPGDVTRFVRFVLPRIARLAGALDASPADIGPAVKGLWDAVAEAAARVWGLPVRALFEEVHRSNMTKTLRAAGNDPGSKYAPGVESKGPGYEPPDIDGVLQKAAMR